MATNTIPLVSNVIVSDTAATGNSLVQRDGSGTITVATCTAAAVQTASYIGTPSTQTASFTAGAATDYFCDATAGTITVTLPLASASTGRVYNVVKKDSSTNGVTVTAAVGTTSIGSQYGHIRFVSDGSLWYGSI